MKETREYGGRKPLSSIKKKSEAIRVRLTKQEIDIVNDLHSKSYHSNFSALVRDILFNKRVGVEVCNIELSTLKQQLDSIKKSCDSIIRMKKDESMEMKLLIDEIKPLIDEIKSQVLSIKSNVESLTKTDLYLTDLREITEYKKYDENDYYFLNYKKN
jgi:hypothetical protein